MAIIQEYQTFVCQCETVVIDLVILHHRVQLVDFLSDTDNEIVLDPFSENAGETEGRCHDDSKQR